ncbi:hypothetical protein HLY00_1114 [Mycolicibacterium hippocampi]|uniref:Uncharacterized protein n=1 Tax=Mycolicibacterium hippocampi TaxID=659824 RepID=A0A850PLU8_9MYCO|nr:hypothetical protein [Mycolicibacterium hippocampi]
MLARSGRPGPPTGGVSNPRAIHSFHRFIHRVVPTLTPVDPQQRCDQVQRLGITRGRHAAAINRRVTARAKSLARLSNNLPADAHLGSISARRSPGVMIGVT